MARYIDEKDVYKLVEPTGIARVHCSQIDELPRADVVPKSEYDAVVSAVDNSTKEFLKLHDAYQNAKAEVERLQKYNTDVAFKHYNDGKKEVAREIFEEIDIILSEHYGKASEKTDSKLLEPLRQAQRFVINEIYDDLAELKKEYTGEEV